MVWIHNSLSGKKELLRPYVDGEVSMYLCGDTVYDLCHMGHARSKIAFDVVRRYLLARGYKVRFVRNITDVDDKIIQRAAEQGRAIDEFTDHYIREMHRDYDALGILRPDSEPLATVYIEEMVSMIEQLMDKGHAYLGASGDVLYSVASFAHYGQLSGRRLSELRAGERVAVDEAKRDPLDFVLWKRAKPGEPCWHSPWGPGRPGWHIECSAMASCILGTHFDIHCGGLDLKFPHHENEIAQACAASGDSFARLWMHNGFLNVNQQKMAKSLGNFFTIREVLAQVREPEVIRYFILSSHYRGPIDYSLQSLEQADAALERIYLALRGVTPASAGSDSFATDASQRFHAAMEDDFNTPLALAELQGLARDLNIAKGRSDGAGSTRLAGELTTLANILGLVQQQADAWLRKPRPAAEDAPLTENAAALSDADIEQRVQARTAARAAKNWAESDRIRDELSAAGVLLEDAAGTTQWRRK
jgi:cysteinyl-tRNA synthetase